MFFFQPGKKKEFLKEYKMVECININRWLSFVVVVVFLLPFCCCRLTWYDQIGGEHEEEVGSR